LLATLNTTHISLIPKNDNPKYFEEFRLISLYNCIYNKIIVKIIARRVKRLLLRVISNEQFRFLEGIQIHEVVGVAQEGIHSMKTKLLYSLVIKIDLSKAYDRVS
jgi:hypothetical protein